MRWTVIALALAAGVPASHAQAHAMPNSTVVVAATAEGFEAEVSIPRSELEASIGGRVDLNQTLESYVRAHVAVTGEGGRVWPMTITRMELAGGDHPALVLKLAFGRPQDGDRGPVSLRYDAVTHRVASHYVLIHRRVGGELMPLGRLQSPETTLKLP